MAPDQPLKREHINILLVDDREDNLTVLEAVLDSPDYRLIKAHSGREAVMLAQAQEFAVIILDVQMPIMDGFEAAKQIRRDGLSKNVPIIFVTAIYGDQEYVNLGYNVGAVDYIFKPFNPYILCSKVNVFADLYRKNKLLLKQSEALRAIESREKALQIIELEMQSLKKQTQLEKLTQRLGLIVQRAPLALFCIDQNGTFTLTEGRGLESLHLHHGAFTGTNVANLPDEWNQFLGIVSAGMQGHEVVAKIEIGAKTFDAFVTSEKEEAQKMSVVVILRDITDEQFLTRTSIELSESLKYQATIEKVTELIVPRLADTCFIHMKDEEVNFMAATDVPPMASATTSELKKNIDLIMEHGQSVLETHRLYTPLRVRAGNIGVLTCTRKNSTFKQEELHLFEEVARRAAAAIDNARLYRDAEKAVQTRDEFMSIAAHELRTPLTPLKIQFQTLLKLMRDGRFANLSEETLATMLLRSDRQIDRIANLIEDFLNVSRINMGRLTIERHQTDLGKLIRDVSEQFREQLTHSKCELKVSASETIQGTWDSFKIEQVVVNLLTNAIKYGAGSPISISAAEDESSAFFTIEDQGIGIDVGDQERIFALFERAVSARNYGGLGLGLYIVKNIVTEHGGTISVESKLGRGSRFTVRLPKFSKNTLGAAPKIKTTAVVLNELH